VSVNPNRVQFGEGGKYGPCRGYAPESVCAQIDPDSEFCGHSLSILKYWLVEKISAQKGV